MQDKKTNFKKLSLFDLAAARVVNGVTKAEVKKGDLIEIVEPFTKGENYLGIIMTVTEKYMHVYHSDIRKTIVWDRRVKCLVSSV